MTYPKTIQTLIISDLHLKEEATGITQLFEKFIHQIAIQSQELIILGDFFEFWIGDDAMSDFQKSIAQQLALLAKTGTQIFIMPGNRDLLLGKKFCQEAHAQLLPEIIKKKYLGKQIIFCHGDQLCTGDTAYQNYRKQVHKPWVKKLFLSLPVFIRRLIAQKIRKNSKENFKKYPVMVDVEPKTVLDFLIKNKAEILIHGHTHQKIYETLNQNNFTRIVNSDWGINHGSFIEINSEGIFLKDFV